MTQDWCKNGWKIAANNLRRRLSTVRVAGDWGYVMELVLDNFSEYIRVVISFYGNIAIVLNRQIEMYVEQLFIS